MSAQVFLHDEYAGMLAKVANREEILDYAEQIPPLPQATLKVMELLDDPDSDIRQLAEVVCGDARLVAAVLKLACSPAYGQTGGAISIQQAITQIGANQLRALALMTTLIGSTKQEAMDRLIWEHSLATALIARRLAEEVARPLGEEVFLMGLLHNLGQFIFLANPKTRRAYPEVLKRIQESSLAYVDAEHAVIGFSHPLIGALVANRWNFPAEVCQIILHYTDPLESIGGPANQKLALVKLADGLAHAAFIGHPSGYPIDLDMIEDLAKGLGLFSANSRGMVELIVLARNLFRSEAKAWAS